MITKNLEKKNAKTSTKIGEKHLKGDEIFDEKKGGEKPTKKKQRKSS